MVRAMARRTVMKESATWRSGREEVRDVSIRCAVRRGEMPSTLGDDECVAGQGHRDVVMPSLKASSLEVIETQLTLEILVGALGSPPLLDVSNQLLLGNVGRSGDEVELGWLRLAVLPLHQEPNDFSFGAWDSFVGNRQHTPRCKLGRELAAGSLSPGRSTKPTSVDDLVGVLGNAQGLAASATATRIELPHLGRRIDGHSIRKAFFPHLASKPRGVSVGRIDQCRRQPRTDRI